MKKLLDFVTKKMYYIYNKKYGKKGSVVLWVIQGLEKEGSHF